MPHSEEDTRQLPTLGQYSAPCPSTYFDHLVDGDSQLHPHVQQPSPEVQNMPIAPPTVPGYPHESRASAPNAPLSGWYRLERALVHERSKNDTLTRMLQSLLSREIKDAEVLYRSTQAFEKADRLGVQLRGIQEDIAEIKELKLWQEREAERLAHQERAEMNMSRIRAPSQVAKRKSDVLPMSAPSPKRHRHPVTQESLSLTTLGSKCLPSPITPTAINTYNMEEW